MTAEQMRTFRAAVSAVRISLKGRGTQVGNISRPIESCLDSFGVTDDAYDAFGDDACGPVHLRVLESVYAWADMPRIAQKEFAVINVSPETWNLLRS